MLQKRKNFYLNSGHSRTNSYDSYAQAISKQWLEQISEEREEQESQLTFQNKHLNNVYSSQNLKSENRYMISSNRNSICNNGNGNTTRRSSISGGDNEKSLSSLYSQQNQKGIQPSQQNTPQMSVVAPSVASSSTYMPQYSLNVIDPHLNNSEFESNNQLSPLDRKANNDLFNQQIHRKRNQHYRSQSCPYSFPYFKYSQNQTNEESNLQNGQNIRVMTIHEEEPYHNYVNSSSYQHSSNNSTRNKYRQQQPYRSNTNYRSASGGDYSISNFYQNTSQTPTTIVLEKKLQQNTNANLPFTSTPFCFENPSMGQNNHAATDQADEDQYLQESFYSQVYDGDQNHEFSVIKDKNTVNVSNKPSLENKIDREEIESNKECKNNKLKAQNQIQQLHLSSSAQNNQNTRYRGPSLVNDLGNNSNSCSMNIVKSLNQLDTDQGFISFRKEHSCSSQEGFVENFRSSHNSIDIDLKQKIKENIDKILKRQASKRQNRLILMLNNILNQFEKYDLDMNDFLHLLSKKSKLNIIQKASSFSQNGSSSGKNPSIPLIQSYQGSTNAHSFSIQNHAQTKGYQRSKNFWSYDFSNASKSMIPSDTISAYKKEFDDENNLRKAIMDGFQKISQQKNLYSSQILSQINDNPANSTQTSSQQINYQFMQPTAKFINDQHNLQLPQKISAETFKKVAIPLNTAPSSLQQFQNKDLRFNINKSDSKNKNNSNNKKNKEVDYSSNFQPATQSNVGSTFTFIGNHNESKNITNPQNANNQLQSSIPIIQHKSGFNQTQLNETNQQYSSNQNVLVQPQQQKNLEATQTSLQANQNNQYQNHNYSLNNLKNQTNGNNNPLNIKNQQTNPNNQLSNNLQGFGNTNNSINNSASHNLNNFLLNRISEECESPANTTYKQHQEYLNYESEQYLTGSKSKYHKKQQLMASGESNNTSSKPLDDGSSSQQIQILDNLLQSNENQKTNKIENCSTQNQLQQIPSEYKIYYNQNNIHNIQEQKEISQNQNTTTIFNLLNHTIANPNNLNQSNQQNPSANNSWLSSRSYEIFIPEENKLKSYADAQMLSFSKIKNAPSSHLSSQKSLNGVNNNQNYNQDFNDLQSNPQAANQNFAINQASISITSIKRVKSGENSPNDEDNIRFNQSQEIQENLNKKEQNLLKRNTNEQNFQTASQRFEYMNGFQIIQNLTKSLNQYQIKKDLQQAAQSQYQSASSSQTKSKEGVENIHSPYLSKFPSKISEEQSKMVSSGSYFNTSNNNLNINVTNQNKMMLSSNQFSNASQHLNTQNDNQNNVIQSITTENTLEQYNSTKQNVISNNKQNVHLTNSSRINQSNVNNMNNILNCSNSNHNTHNLNNNQVCSHRSSSNSNSNSNLHSHFNDNQTYQSVERSTEPYLQIEIQIERKQNNHNLLIQALKNKLQHTNPNIFAEIEEHIRMRPSYCFILVLQEDQYERAVLKGIFHVVNRSLATLSYQIQEIQSTIRIEDVDQFLKIDQTDYSFKLIDESNSLKKVDGIILQSESSQNISQ